jgi:predicted nucleic acid-binding protein
VKTAIYDANVLYPSTLRDVLIRVGKAELVQPKWTKLILDETFTNLASNRPDIGTDRLKRTRELMNKAFLDAVVEGYEKWLQKVKLPDANDNHVLAAAIHSGASIIVTKNLKDFPKQELEEWGIVAKHPDIFLVDLVATNAETFVLIVEDIAATWRTSDSTPYKVLDSLNTEAPKTVEAIRKLGSL